MLTKKVKKRALFLSLLLLFSVIAIFFILKTLTENILYFKSPTDIKLSEDIKINKKIRIGGMVKKDSLNINDKEIKFIVTDYENELLVSYSGTVPNLFSEGKGVVAEGKLQDKKYFIADRILAKHDENYMPPELSDIIKKMLSSLGNTILFFNILLSILIVNYSLKSIKNSQSFINNNIYHLCVLQSTSIIICFLTLISAFIISDFSLVTVYQNSHSLKPLIYKISGVWGNHEGSLLLWVIILIIFSFLFLVYNKSHPKKYRLYTLITQNILILGFLFFLIFNSNPFSLIEPTPKEGLGLNPILQDPALAIHPPLLYMGFVGSSIYFSRYSINVNRLFRYFVCKVN